VRAEAEGFDYAWGAGFCLMGTPDDVAAKVKRVAGYGVRNLYIRGFDSYAMPTAVAEAFARTVMPRLR
jgi:alkanesulfonate monooxygenase SsuD/methylene tetrahydromethanopterin reductase-like flavin-dependent oxidoreductase (luciferase family)